MRVRLSRLPWLRLLAQSPNPRPGSWSPSAVPVCSRMAGGAGSVGRRASRDSCDHPVAMCRVVLTTSALSPHISARFSATVPGSGASSQKPFVFTPPHEIHSSQALHPASPILRQRQGRVGRTTPVQVWSTPTSEEARNTCRCCMGIPDQAYLFSPLSERLNPWQGELSTYA